MTLEEFATLQVGSKVLIQVLGAPTDLVGTVVQLKVPPQDLPEDHRPDYIPQCVHVHTPTYKWNPRWCVKGEPNNPMVWYEYMEPLPL